MGKPTGKARNHSRMRLATGNRLIWQVSFLLLLCAVAAAHLHIFLDVCLHNDVKVSCVPSCPKICVDNLIRRKCRPVRCKRGCVCKDGWVRQGSITGKCIRRSSCTRWVI
ncbi:uncharacterized protein Dvir_GJ26608 [Drosophila virilis]|uniref:TIL domain-containing protein n=1 Tax=Drosophila virilis TaxID=7244 RepID=A0A0Q9W4V6_DROVI|nr:uncharacterized protein LOC26531378 [Drosophila virilis]KRF79858.1 uncharacterized protein Dvir_GJ26608 [Drosophila virilis]